jgi:hypothetical protein
MNRLLCRATLVVLAVFPLAVSAGGDIEAIYGTGPDNYRSYELNGSVDLPVIPVTLDGSQFIARSDGSETMNQITAGATWNATDWLSASYRRSVAKSDVFDVFGDEYGLGFNVDALWNGKLQTRIDLGYAGYGYEAAAGNPAARAALNPRLPEQHKRSVALTQDLTESLRLSLGYDQYVYTKDPIAIARAILRRVRQPNSGVFELIGFPERGTTTGLSLSATEALDLDLSYARTYTVISQRQENTRLGVTWEPAKHYRVGAVASRSRSGVIRSPAGAVVQPESASTNYEMSLRISFD